MYAGCYDDDFWLLPSHPSASQILLALPNFVHQLCSMGFRGNVRSLNIIFMSFLMINNNPMNIMKVYPDIF